MDDMNKQRRKERRRSQRNSRLADTVLDDSRNEALDAHSYPFLSVQEQTLEKELEVASVVSSVDSDNYEFRGSVSGLLSVNSKVDAAYRQLLQRGGSK